LPGVGRALGFLGGGGRNDVTCDQGVEQPKKKRPGKKQEVKINDREAEPTAYGLCTQRRVLCGYGCGWG
jgi:hypothetical protein